MNTVRLPAPALAPVTTSSGWGYMVILGVACVFIWGCSDPTPAQQQDDSDAALADGAVQADANASADAGGDGSVVAPDGCVPSGCAALGHECGDWDDGCGLTISCGGCDTGQVCNAGQCGVAPVDCGGIANNPSLELCDSGADFCSGVFTAGEGCTAYCAAAGLVCTLRTGGESGCQQEPQIVLACGENNGHQSDWCECGRPDPNPTCPVDPLDPPVYQDQHYSQATYFNRSAWVLDCYDYAYTAYQNEHEACDSQYSAGSAQGTATFTFTVGRGEYDVYIEGRHTANRNPAGALVTVTSAGQTFTTYIMQRDSSGSITLDLHGRYCLEGQVVVVVDSTVSTASDSVRRVVLEPVP